LPINGGSQDLYRQIMPTRIVHQEFNLDFFKNNVIV
jgi:hypothetical protein